MDIAKIAMCIVGYTEMLKGLFGVENKVVKTLMTLVVGVGITALSVVAPEKVLDGAAAIAVATVAYDVILKKLMKYGSE